VIAKFENRLVLERQKSSELEDRLALEQQITKEFRKWLKKEMERRAAEKRLEEKLRKDKLVKKQCPRCRFLVSDDVNFCPRCGAEIEQQWN